MSTLPLPARDGGHLRGLLILCLATFLWGTTFVVVKGAVDYVSPAFVVFSRFLIAAVALSPWLVTGGPARGVWPAAVELGVLLWGGYATQAVALKYTTVNRCAFITTLHVVIVPLLSAAMGRASRPAVYIGAVMALAGVGCLSYDGSPPNQGDWWTLACAVVWSTYIARLEGHATALPTMRLTAAHLWVVAGCSAVWMIAARGTPTTWHLPWAAIVYLGLPATAATVWLQTAGQKRVTAPQAAILYTMEPVWAALFGWILLGERLGSRGWLGAGLILSAALVAQLKIGATGSVEANPSPPPSALPL